MELSVRLVATRRPDLIERTLSSFSAGLFANFSVSASYANVDPAFGSLEDAKRSVEIIKDLIPNVTVYEPETPSFGAAVKRLWSIPANNIVLHMEDDWTMLEPITPDQISQLASGKVAATVLRSDSLGHAGESSYLTRQQPITIAGYEIFSRRVTKFGTSPCFISGPFCTALGHLMNPDLDPEKQMRKYLNPEMQRLIEKNKCSILHGKNGPVIEDIGRDWREDRNIKKEVKDGKSTWSQAGPD